MRYSAPLLSICAKSIRVTTSSCRVGRLGLMLPLSFCVLLMGCDAQSSSSPPLNGTVNSNTASDSLMQSLTSKDTSVASEVSMVNADENMEDEEGQPLIAIAKTDDSNRARRAPMISAKNTGSTLQATLIGDYTGMVPCSFCDGIALTLNLFADGSVLKTSIYENPESPRLPLTESGVYRQDDNRIIIVYGDKRIESYRIQDNHLIMLDKNKMADADYTLSSK